MKAPQNEHPLSHRGNEPNNKNTNGKPISDLSYISLNKETLNTKPDKKESSSNCIYYSNKL